MAVLINTKYNEESQKHEVFDFQVIPRNQRPVSLDEGQFYFDTVDNSFYINYYRYYVEEGVLHFNPSRVSVEACVGV